MALMIHIREIDYVVLRVTNLEAMLRFYCEPMRMTLA
jgi:hypothetical protein